METITSKSNRYIKLCRSLHDKGKREESGYCLLEGRKIITEALKNDYKPEYIFVTGEKYDEVVKEYDCEIIIVNRELIEYISTTKTPQDMIGICRIKKNKFQNPSTNYLVLDTIQDPTNLGAIIRTAVATGFTTIYTINCVDEYNEKVIRGSMGNIFRCKVIHITYNEIDKISKGLYICDLSGDNIFNILTFNKIVGLCIGNEGHGVSEEIRQKVSDRISLPMMNGVESLNAGVSAGIIMYHIKVNQKEI